MAFVTLEVIERKREFKRCVFGYLFFILFYKRVVFYAKCELFFGAMFFHCGLFLVLWMSYKFSLVGYLSFEAFLFDWLVKQTPIGF